MCMKLMKVRSVNAHSPKFYYVPCGKCEECRSMERSSWEFRFRCEVESFVIKQNWQMCFFTLTYNNENLPYLPHHVFKCYDETICASSEYLETPCFNKEHIRKLISGIRKYLNKHYGVKRLVYLICSEFGSATRRPHYHGSIVFPPNVPPNVVYGLIRDLWCGEDNVLKPTIYQKNHPATTKRPNLGFVCPRTIDGVGKESPFMVNSADAGSAAAYVSKYVCKDLDFIRSLPFDRLDFSNHYLDDRENEDDELDLYKLSHLRQYLPFHFQTRSLGCGILKDATDEELLQIYRQGVNFLGKDRFQCAPAYIKNKIIFTPYYQITDDGRRLVRREASEFFNRNYKEIFEKKVIFYEKLFNTLCEGSYYKSCGLPDRICEKFSAEAKKIVDFMEGDTRSMAIDYLLYFGVPFEKCYYSTEPAKVYLNHYSPDDGYQNCLFQISRGYYDKVNYYTTLLLGFYGFCNKINPTDEEILISKVNDFWKHFDPQKYEDNYNEFPFS